MAPDARPRCHWALASQAGMVEYHDREWGVPVHDERTQFEFLVLESAQAGLSWYTVLRKREAYRRAFAGFDPVAVARYTQADVERLLGDVGLIRNRAKIEAAVGNARCFLEIQAQHGGFADFLWRFVDGKQVVNHWRVPSEVPATTPLSDRLAREMKRRGFRFLGSTVLYAHLQATGLVNDHLVSCFRHGEVAA